MSEYHPLDQRDQIRQCKWVRSDNPCPEHGPDCRGYVVGRWIEVVDLRAEYERLKRTVNFQEKTYLKHHGGSWGKCKYQAENERLRSDLWEAISTFESPLFRILGSADKSVIMREILTRNLPSEPNPAIDAKDTQTMGNTPNKENEQ